MGKHETTALFMGAMGEAQQIVIDKVDAAIEEAQRRGFAMGEAQAFRATIEGRENDVEVLVRYFANVANIEHPTRHEVEDACNKLRRHFAALRASRIDGAPPEGAFLEGEHDDQPGTYAVHIRAEVAANSIADARIQIASIIETGVEGSEEAENAITSYQITCQPVRQSGRNWRGEPQERCYQCGSHDTSPSPLDGETRHCNACGIDYGVVSDASGDEGKP